MNQENQRTDEKYNQRSALSLRAHIYINMYFWGRQRHLLLLFSGSTLKTTTGVSPRMPVFGSGTSRLRFGASRSRLDVISGDPGRYPENPYIYIYIYIYGFSGHRPLDSTGDVETRPGRAETEPTASLGEKHAC